MHPEKLLLLMKENEKLISSILPELISKFNSVKLKQTVEVFQGLGGMKTFYDDMTKAKEIIMPSI